MHNGNESLDGNELNWSFKSIYITNKLQLYQLYIPIVTIYKYIKTTYQYFNISHHSNENEKKFIMVVIVGNDTFFYLLHYGNDNYFILDYGNENFLRYGNDNYLIFALW